MPLVHFALVILEIGSLKTFAWAGLKTTILLISVSQVARIADVNHQLPVLT
jgi:hypothetical protein